MPEVIERLTCLAAENEPTDPTAFDRHYHDVHVPLTRQLPGLIDYTVVRDPQQVRGAAYYQIAELTWPDWETARAAFASPQGQATAADMVSLDAPTRSCLYEVP